MKSQNLDEEDQYTIIFDKGDWPERCVWDRLFQKNWKLLKSKVQNNVKHVLKWVQKNAPGVSRAWGGSKLRSESNGMPPGPQNGNKKIKKYKEP